MRQIEREGWRGGSESGTRMGRQGDERNPKVKRSEEREGVMDGRRREGVGRRAEVGMKVDVVKEIKKCIIKIRALT